MVRKALYLALLCATAAFCEQVGVSEFSGLNNNESPLIIGISQASDLQNVDVTPGGKSVKKRPGFGVYKDIDVGGVHGGHHFFDSTGNDVQVWGSSKSLTGIVSDGAPTVLVSSATEGATWDCADTQGFAYCVNSIRDVYVRTTGAAIAWQTSPLGTMIEATPDRMVVAGVVAAPSSLYISAANSFLAAGYTVGSLNSDAFIEPITAPGSHITHIRWACGKLLWWKDQSFGYTQFEDQYTLENKIVSDTIGTFDNTSAIDPGGNVWFRGQDGHIWRYDCSGLTKESIEITPNIQSSGRRTSNSWTQTTQADYNAGRVIPVLRLSTAIVNGDIMPTSFTVTSNLTSTVAGNDMTNNSFESETGGGPAFTGWAGSCSWAVGTSQSTTHCGTISAYDGSNFLANTIGQNDISLEIIDANTSALISSSTINTDTQTCGWTLFTGQATPSGQSVKVKLIPTAGGGCSFISSAFTSNGNTIKLYYQADNGGAGWRMSFDYVHGSPVLGVSSITATSSVYDTGVTSSMAQMQAQWSATISTANFSLFHSPTSGGTYVEVLSSTGTNTFVNRYLKVSSTVSFPASGVISSSVTIVARSTGTFYSDIKNSPNISTWGTFNPTSQLNDGTIAYNIRRATQSFTVLSSTPSSWTLLTPNSLITASVGTYFQISASFTVTAATQNPTINDFTVNWYDGSASDQVYMHYFDNAIWTSVAFGVGVSSNTHIFRRDLVNDGWTVYNFGTGGFLTQSNRLYFGDVSTGGNVFLYGSGTSDNGSAINAYWKSKEFTGTDPFNENQLTQIDLIASRDSNQSLTTSYTLGTSSTTAYTISLSSSATSIITHRKTLPAGKNGYTFNVKYSNNSTTGAFELLGYRLGYIQLPWKPSQ